MIVTADTRYGKIRGTTDGGVHAFCGTPFARPPVGELRFRPPPRPPEPSRGVREARAFGTAAPQHLSRVAPLFDLRIDDQRP